MNFFYDPQIEQFVLEKYVVLRKHKSVAGLFTKELEMVKIDERDDPVVSQIRLIEQNWQKVAKNFYRRLGEFYEKELSEPELTCFLIRLDIFPYDYRSKKKWFSAPLFGNPAERNRIIMHELCHYFQPVELPRAIKEAIPVILNDHDVFQVYGFDRGHNDPEEQKWRKIIFNLYKQGKKFTEIQKLIKRRL